MSGITWRVLLLGVAAALARPGGALAQECPTQSFLIYDGFAYASELLPGDPIASGAAVGSGDLDRATSEDGCERERLEVSVHQAGEIDPAVAVTVAGAPGILFVQGARCSGYEGTARRTCLLEPLLLEGRSYTGSQYPAGTGTLPLGADIGEAELGDERVTAVRIEGVDPAAAVGIAGRTGEAFLAAGVCPYERFAETEAADDLARCLEAPFWLVFDTLGARVGRSVVARSDRALPAVAADATVSLVRLETAADAVPPDLSGAVPIGTLVTDDTGAGELRFDVPELEQGRYEAVVSCEACAEAFGGSTIFPAGSLIVFEGRGSSGPEILFYVLGGAFVITLVASVVLWRRGWRITRRRRA